ncbi:MAG: FAD-binding protein [Anaerolineales bacterium]|nr:FAD-binding protein [Anaerolineales bacterium]
MRASLSLDFIHDLKKRFSGDLRLNAASKILYSTDASSYQIEPLGVAVPKTQDDLQAAVELAAQYRIPILPRGSGSSLAGQAVGAALILDCSRHLVSIVDINREEHFAVVEPGVILTALNRAAAQYGLTFGPDPASAERATLGGVIGNNATGAHSILYGMSADHLLGADVLLGDGSAVNLNESTFDSPTSNPRLAEIILTAKKIRAEYADAIKQNYPTSWRNSAGYRLNYLLPWSPSAPPRWPADDYGLPSTVYRADSVVNLARLLAGSEGTLAVFRKLKVNLVPKPKRTILGVLAYESIDQACDDVPRLLKLNPSAVELIPRLILQNARGVPAYARQMEWASGDPAAILAVEFSGEDLASLREQVKGCRGGAALTVAESPESQNQIWTIRKMGLGILDSRPTAARPTAFIEDCAIPVEKLGAFAREIERIFDEHQTFGGIYAHASAGCLHIRPVLDLRTGAGVKALRDIAERVLALTLSLGGSMSSEHGDGIARGEFIERTYGRAATQAMRLLKRAADPDGILNPQKLFDAPPMDSHLRYGETYRAQTWIPVLQFGHERGLAGAIEACNGQGVCRKFDGVMCPSFQATREEGLSTRGRSNLLRALIADGGAAGESLTQETFRALDLCLACKGCTSECPSGVDMPKLKYEFMNHYYQSHRRPLRDYLFGYFHFAAKMLSPLAPLVNWMMNARWSHRLIAKMLGLAERRPFPKFVKNKNKNYAKKEKAVILLSDVFSHYIEPEVERAAIDILNALGYEVKILRTIGAGASLLSKGFLRAAQRHAKKVLAEIRRLDGGAGLSVVGCEPPEIYCIKHEYESLLPNQRDEIKSLKKRAWLLDEFILRVANKSLANLSSVNLPITKILLQPHCHHRAEGLADDGVPAGVPATVEMLKRFGYDVEVMNSGCCGMAGTFGFEANHYDLSMQIGGVATLPQARKLDGRVLASSGAACRMQIQHGAGVAAKHPLILVRERLELFKQSEVL